MASTPGIFEIVLILNALAERCAGAAVSSPRLPACRTSARRPPVSISRRKTSSHFAVRVCLKCPPYRLFCLRQHREPVSARCLDHVGFETSAHALRERYYHFVIALIFAFCRPLAQSLQNQCAQGELLLANAPQGGRATRRAADCRRPSCAARADRSTRIG
jgi:hypothetical protein